MRLVLALAALAGCGFETTLGAASGDDVETPIVCDANRCRMRVDTSADFAEAETAVDIAIDGDAAAAVLTPAAYVRGAVIARGSNTAYGSFATGVDWAGIDAATVDGVAFTEPDLVPSQVAPTGVGITDNGDWTYWIEGEVELAPGVSMIELRGDDFAALQIAPPNSRAFADVVEATFPDPVTAMFDAGAGGWFPFRAAVVQTNGGGSGMQIRITAPLAQAIAPLARAQLRARVDGLRGTGVVAWDDRLATGPAVASLYTRPLLDDEIDQPLAPGLTSADDLGQRWYGQLRVRAAGDYTLRTISDDGNRVWLAGQLSEDRLEDSAANVTTTVTATLRAGWNDLVVDYSQGNGSENIRLEITQAPAGVATGTIPAADLRPVAPRRRGYVTHADAFATPMPIPNNTTAGVDVPITFDPLGGEIVREVRVTYDIQHGMLGEIDVDLIHDGKTAVLRANSQTASRYHKPTAFDGGPLDGAWTLHVDDESGGMTGSLRGWSLTVFTEGGPGQIAERAEWISTPRDLGAMGTVLAIDELDAQFTLPPGSTAELYVRTCAEPAACASEAWSGPFAPGAVSGITAARYAQLRVVLTSNGTDEPALDAVELGYQVSPL